MTEQHPSRASEAFFGRRKGKPLRERQAQGIATLLPALKLDLSMAAPDDLATLFSVGVDEIRLGSGFAGGEHLVHSEQEKPSTGLIGYDPFVKSLAKLLGREEDV